MSADLFTVREAIDALAVMPGYAPMAKAAEMALQRVSATDHEGRPMVAAALARPGWRPRLAHVERLLAGALQGHELAEDAPHTFRRGEVADLEGALDEVRAMLDGDPAKGAEPWQKRLAVIEAKLIEMVPSAVPGHVFVPSDGYAQAMIRRLAELLPQIRALIES